ncbi:MAG: hypothetical protein ACT4QE_05070 [Anaerolineales bacterium]
MQSHIARVAHRSASAQYPKNTEATMPNPWPQDGTLISRKICEQALRASANCVAYDFRCLTHAIVADVLNTVLHAAAL